MTHQNLPKIGDTFNAIRSNKSQWNGTITAIESITPELVDVEIRWAKRGKPMSKEWITDIANLEELIAEVWSRSDVEVM